jgi:Trk K+ transport system NAD-binding subunit
MKGKKHIVVIGLGEFGRELAQQLAKECEILALDREEALVPPLTRCSGP